MKRRVLLVASGALAALTAARVRAQPASRPYRIGILAGAPRPFPSQFAKLMGEHGWVEGRDFVVDWRIADAMTGLFDTVAAELAIGKTDVLVVFNTAGALAARRATTSIPIVMVASGFPVEVGLAASLARPGGNVTGNTAYAGLEVWGKYLEILRELLPRMRRVSMLFDWVPPGFPDSPVVIEELRRAERAMGISLTIIEVRTREDAVRGLARVAKDRPDALFVTSGPVHNQPDTARELMAFAVRHRLPTMTDHKLALVRAGCLMAYAADLGQNLPHAISYVVRTLKGANPGDLPIRRPEKVEFIVNRRTARAIGLNIPQSLLMRADQVIE